MQCMHQCYSKHTVLSSSTSTKLLIIWLDEERRGIDKKYQAPAQVLRRHIHIPMSQLIIFHVSLIIIPHQIDLLSSFPFHNDQQFTWFLQSVHFCCWEFLAKTFVLVCFVGREKCGHLNSESWHNFAHDVKDLFAIKKHVERFHIQMKCVR